MSQAALRFTNERRALIAAAEEAEDHLHTNAMQILVAHALHAGVTQLTLIADESDDSLRIWRATINGTTHTKFDLPDNARRLTQAAQELPAFTQHSFTDYLTHLPDDPTFKEQIPMEVNLARAAADYGIPA